MPKVLGNTVTLVDQIKQIGPDGTIMTIAETMSELNEILQDATMTQANDTFQHTTLIPKSLGQTKPRMINAGAQRTAPKMTQMQEQIMLLDVIHEVDEELVDNMPDKNKARWNRVKLALEGAMQELSRIFFYGNKGEDAAEIDGYFTRFNDLSLDNVVSVGNSGTSTSIVMMEYGELKNTLIYPRGAKNAGIEDIPHGKQRVTDDDNAPYFAYIHQIKARFGISIPDPRAVQRLCNIAETGTSDNLVDTGKMNLLVGARNRLPGFGKNAVIYCNRDTKTQFDIYALDKSNGFYTIQNITGEPISYWQGIPIKMAEQLTSEDEVT